jgi:DNA-directed RNA polymerase specialized sigma subunit
MEAKQYLRKAYRLHELIESEKAELDALRELAQSVSSSSVSDMPRSPSRDNAAPYENHVLKMVDLEAKINREIQEYLAIGDEIREVINRVEDNEERLLLRNRYIHYMEWDDICDKMHMSRRTIHRIHSSALRNVRIPERWH